MNARTLLIGLAVLMLNAGTVFAENTGERFALESASVRYGFAANNLSSGYQQAEGAVDFTLPFKWSLGGSWELKPRLDFSVGSLWRGHDEAVIGSIGPVLSLGPRDFPVKLEGGVSPTLISRHDFGTSQLGIPFQFSDRIGIAWNINERWRVGYWFQHMSNAGLDDHNKGVNLHFFSASYCF